MGMSHTHTIPAVGTAVMLLVCKRAKATTWSNPEFDASAVKRRKPAQDIAELITGYVCHIVNTVMQ
jgi:hypothetical protein